MKNAWQTNRKIAVWQAPTPMPIILKPSSEQVEYAMIFFMSNCTMPMVAANTVVAPPISVTKANVPGASFSSGPIRVIRNTPAVTIVAAWISAEMGVGPAMASGRQVCRKICADLPMAPMNSSVPIAS